MNNKIIQIIAAVLIFAAGYGTHAWLHTCPEPEKSAPTVGADTTTETKTEIVYVPKETIIYKDADGQTVEKTEDTDVEINIAKPDLKVKVNGQPFTIEKTDEEKYLFEKNKLQFNQSSSAAMEITVPTIDNTHRWEIGVGISDDGPVGLVGFPIKKHMGGWIAGGNGHVMAGVSLKI